jgi:hypothetical protein
MSVFGSSFVFLVVGIQQWQGQSLLVYMLPFFFSCSLRVAPFFCFFLGSSSSVLLCFLPVLLSVFSLLGEVAFAQPL